MARCFVSTACFTLLVGVPSATPASDWVFTSLVEQDGSFLGFINDPSLNNAGDVVFVAEIPEENGSGSDLGLFRTAGEAIEQVAFSNGLSPYRDQSFAQFPVISDSGQVAFRAVSFWDGSGLYTGPDPAVDSIVSQASDGISGVGFFPAMNGAGDVLFYATRPGGLQGIYSGPDPVSDRLVDNAGPFEFVGTQFDLNDLGGVIFEAFLPGGVAGLYTGPDPVTDLLVDSTGPFADTFFSPRINDRGDLVFYAELDSGVSGLFTGPDPVADLLVDDTGPFEFLGGGLLNNVGDLLFSASFDGGRVGIFDGVDVESDRVIGTGDPLFGSTVTDLGAYDAYNDAGRLVFRYTLADGRQGIALAAQSLIGDADGDGDVDGDDMIAVQTNFGSVTPPPGDADGDGDVDGDDLIAVQTNFGATSPSTAVPEPATIALLFTSGLCLMARRVP